MIVSDNVLYVVETIIRVSQPGTQILNNDNSYEILGPKPLHATKTLKSKLGSLKVILINKAVIGKLVRD